MAKKSKSSKSPFKIRTVKYPKKTGKVSHSRARKAVRSATRKKKK